MKPFPKNPEKLLIRSTNWIGDAVMTTPAIRSIRDHFPTSEITLLALPWVSDVFSTSPRVDSIFEYQKNGIHKGLQGKIRLASDLRKQHFDAAILLQNAFEAAFISTLAGIPARGGYTTDGRRLLLTHPVKKKADIGDKHQVYYYQEMLEGLGLHSGPDDLELFVSPEVQLQCRERYPFIRKKSPNQKIIGFNPGAAYGPAKRWPKEHFASLAGLICKQSDAKILVFGTEDDTQTANYIREQSGYRERIVDLTAKTSLQEAIALIDTCDVFVTNDSGLMHVAAALGTPLAAIFGSTDHIATGPFSTNSTIIRKPLECSPCKKTHCPLGHLKCMKQIIAQDVFNSLNTYL